MSDSDNDSDSDSAVRARLLAVLQHDARAPLARIAAQARAVLAGAGSPDYDPDACGHAVGAVDVEAHFRADAGAMERALRLIDSAARRQLEWLSDVQLCARHACVPPELAPAPAWLHALLRQAERDGQALLDQMNAAQETGAAGGGGVTCRADGAVPDLALIDGPLLAQALRKLLEWAIQCAGAGAAAAAGAGADAGADITLALEAMPAVARPDTVMPVETLKKTLQWTVRGGTPVPQETWRALDRATPSEHDFHAPGLALAGQLVRAMGGVLWQADPGCGWRFALDAEIAREEQAMPPAPRFDAPPPFGQGHQVLLLESHAAMRDYVTEILDGACFDVCCHADDLTPGTIPALVLCAGEEDDGAAWHQLAALHQRYGTLMPPVLLHALRPPRRPPDFPEEPDFTEVLYRPAPPDALLAALRRQLAFS